MQDPRLILAQEWLELSPGAQDIFTLLEKRQQVRDTRKLCFLLQPLTLCLSVSQ